MCKVFWNVLCAMNDTLLSASTESLVDKDSEPEVAFEACSYFVNDIQIEEGKCYKLFFISLCRNN